LSTVTENTELTMHLTDLNALLVHFHSAVDEQLERSKKEGKSNSLELNTRLENILRRHRQLVKVKCDLYASDMKTKGKEGFTKFLGSIAGLYDRTRSYPESRALRDNYTVLSLYAASLTALKTYGLMIGKEDISKMAYDMLEEVCPFIVEMSHRTPEVVARETAEREGIPFDPAVSARVENAIKRCWNISDT